MPGDRSRGESAGNAAATFCQKAGAAIVLLVHFSLHPVTIFLQSSYTVKLRHFFRGQSNLASIDIAFEMRDRACARNGNDRGRLV